MIPRAENRLNVTRLIRQWAVRRPLCHPPFREATFHEDGSSGRHRPGSTQYPFIWKASRPSSQRFDKLRLNWGERSLGEGERSEQAELRFEIVFQQRAMPSDFQIAPHSPTSHVYRRTLTDNQTILLTVQSWTREEQGPPGIQVGYFPEANRTSHHGFWTTCLPDARIA